jgi:hypothetical protein
VDRTVRTGPHMQAIVRRYRRGVPGYCAMAIKPNQTSIRESILAEGVWVVLPFFLLSRVLILLYGQYRELQVKLPGKREN